MEARAKTGMRKNSKISQINQFKTYSDTCCHNSNLIVFRSEWQTVALMTDVNL